MAFWSHPSSFVDEGAQIGDGTKVWHFCHVMGSARIGEDCALGQNVFVGANVTIGNHVRIQNNVSVYEGVVLEDYVFCGPSMVFTNIRTPRSEFPRKAAGYKETRVGRGATLGANCTVVCGASIGRNALVGAGAVITKDVPPNALMLGVPARRAGWACDCGVPLQHQGRAWRCPECGREYEQVGETVLQPMR